MRAVAFARDWHGAAEGRITVMLGAHAPDMMPLEMLLEAKRAQTRRVDAARARRPGRPRDRADASSAMASGRRPAGRGRLPGRAAPGGAPHRGHGRGGGAGRPARGADGAVLGQHWDHRRDRAPGAAFREAGGLVALGSDQACGNNCNNIFNEMKLTALFNKIKARDPTVFPAWEVLRMATIEGAQAVGLGDEVGSSGGGQAGRPDPGGPDRAEPVAGAGGAGAQHRAEPGLCGERARGQDGDGGGQGAGARRRGAFADEAAVRAEAQVQAEEVGPARGRRSGAQEMALLTAMEARQL